MLGIVLLSAGMFALFLDLGHKLYAWRMYLTFQPGSPMSWGAWILVLVYPALLAAAILHPPERVPFGQGLLALAKRWSEGLHRRPRVVTLIGIANVVGGLALGLYTGILLGSLGARPLWNSAILGPLFLISGLSTAAALMHLLSMLASRVRDEDTYADALLAGLFRLLEPKAGGHAMLQADSSFLSVELVLIGLWLIGLATSTAVHREAADLILSGAYAPAFWSFVVVAGLVAPLVLQFGELMGRIRHTMAPAVLVLVGGFALRWILVSAGQASQW
jgi:formate-dependent nitrite reductase membrane component NrfD